MRSGILDVDHCSGNSCVMLNNMKLFFYGIFVITVFSNSVSDALHLHGSWNTREFFYFLVKFGFQKTNLNNKENTQGFIYGNITSTSNFSHPVTFAVLDRGYFLEYYGNRSVALKEKACKQMFNKIKTAAYNPNCFDSGEDFLRTVPCPVGKVCKDEDKPQNVVPGYQFTFAIQDLRQPRFWYISLVSCYQDVQDCEWHHSNEEISVEYDMWLVNGNPMTRHQNPLEYQFSFDRQDTVELYLLFFACYLILVPLQIFAALKQKHPVTRLFTASLMLEFISLFLNIVHQLKFAFDGVGVNSLSVAGDIIDILSRVLFMLLLLLLAKGWAVTRQELTWKPVVFATWTLYGIIHIQLYVWNLTEVDIIEDIDEYQTWPGWLMITFRTIIMVWFIYELRNTMLYEHNRQKLNFFLHFGAAALVWFIYLPIVALIAIQISALWRFKLLLGITYAVDCLAYCVMAHLLWPTRSEQYFLLAHDMDLGDELDEFNEAPHVVNNYSTSSSMTSPVSSLGIGYSDPPILKSIPA